MKLLEIQDILYQADWEGERQALLFHVTSFENLKRIKSCGLFPQDLVKLMYGTYSPLIGLGRRKENSIFFFISPCVLQNFMFWKKLFNSGLNPYVLTCLFSLYTSVDVSIDDGYSICSDGVKCPNAVSYHGVVPKNNIISIESLEDFEVRHRVSGNMYWLNNIHSILEHLKIVKND